LKIEGYWELGRAKDEQNILSPVTYSPIRRLLSRRGSVVTKSETNKERRMNEQKTNNEWSFSGSTVALQWLYNEQKTVRAARANEQRTNKRRTKDEQ